MKIRGLIRAHIDAWAFARMARKLDGSQVTKKERRHLYKEFLRSAGFKRIRIIEK